MRNTLIIYETHYGTAKKVADMTSLILGNSKSLDINNIKIDISKYTNIVLVFSFYGFDTAKSIKKYLEAVKDTIENKKIAVIGVGLSKDDINNYVADIETTIERKVDYKNFIQGELIIDRLTEEDRKILKTFFKKMHMKLKDIGNLDEKNVLEVASELSRILNMPEKQMDKKKLIDEINKFILEHNTCTLASGSDNFVRNTPIEHIYYKNNFYFISEGGLKFKGILQNPNVCIAIFNNYTSMDNLKGLQISGKSSLVPYLSDEYIELINFKKINIEFVKNLPINLNIIKVEPISFEFLNTDFKKELLDSKQYYWVANRNQ